jgi:hypothetical protein
MEMFGLLILIKVMLESFRLLFYPIGFIDSDQSVKTI